MTTKNHGKRDLKLTELEKKFKKFRKHLATDEPLHKNIFDEFKEQFKTGSLDYYDFIDKMHSYNKSLYEYAEHLCKTGISKIEISDACVVFTTREENIKLVFNGKDRRGVPFDLINWGAYEKSEMRIFDRILTDAMVILDVGANIGWYSLLWGKKYTKSIIHAFEPVGPNYQYLVSNIVINGIKNVIPHNYGLSDKTGEAEFYYYPGGACLASSRNVIGYENPEKLLCKMQTLDSCKHLFLNAGVDFIKCDVEGAELFVLQGGADVIIRDKPVIVLELIYEWCKPFNYQPNDLIEFLKGLDYKVFLPEGDKLVEVHRHVKSDYANQNYFFLHPSRHKKLIKKRDLLRR